MQHLIKLALFLFICNTATIKSVAQTTTDSTIKIDRKDSTAVRSQIVSNAADTNIQAKKTVFEPKPKKAGLYSAILPGSGQIYNRNYWKAPVIYAGMFAAGYFFQFNLEKYHKYRKAYYGRIDSDPNTTDKGTDTERYTDGNLKTLQDEYRKYLDLTVLLSALGYTAQVIDAIVSAHLKNFDISRDISFRFKPVVEPNYIGVGIAMNFK